MNQQLNKDGIKSLLEPFRWAVLMTITFFLAAGRLDIFGAWIAFGILSLGATAGAMLMRRFAPGLANQRASAKEGTKEWDKIILMVYFSLILLIIPLVAGLDVGRFKWSQLGPNFTFAGIIFYAIFFISLHWAMLNNEHFETTSRIQKDRNHKVITSGPYRIVRHPGYVAMIFAGLAYSFTIGSLYALIPSLAAIIVVVIRTFLEDKMLQNELEGYSAYSIKVRYRLFPGIW